MAYVPLASSTAIPDGDYLATLIVDSLLMGSVALPHTVVTVKHNRICLPFLSLDFHTQVLSEGITIATVFPFPLCASEISAFAVNHQPTLQPGSTPLATTPDKFVLMISQDLSPAQASQLRVLLSSFGVVLTWVTTLWDKVQL